MTKLSLVTVSSLQIVERSTNSIKLLSRYAMRYSNQARKLKIMAVTVWCGSHCIRHYIDEFRFNGTRSGYCIVLISLQYTSSTVRRGNLDNRIETSNFQKSPPDSHIPSPFTHPKTNPSSPIFQTNGPDICMISTWSSKCFKWFCFCSKVHLWEIKSWQRISD